MTCAVGDIWSCSLISLLVCSLRKLRHLQVIRCQWWWCRLKCQWWWCFCIMSAVKVSNLEVWPWPQWTYSEISNGELHKMMACLGYLRMHYFHLSDSWLTQKIQTISHWVMNTQVIIQTISHGVMYSKVMKLSSIDLPSGSLQEETAAVSLYLTVNLSIGIVTFAGLLTVL